jgi:hypothetical protein
MSFGAARRRALANRRVLDQRAMETMASRQNVQAHVKRLRVAPVLMAAGGAAAALLVLRRPARALSGLSAVLLRILHTPLGPMAIGAIMSRRTRGAGHEHAHSDRSRA